MNEAVPSQVESAPEFVRALIQRAEAAKASDVHLQMTGQGAAISFRLDGILSEVLNIEPSLAERVFGRIKYLARLKTYQESLPQDGRIDKEGAGGTNDIRVATYPTVTGEKIVLRLFVETETRQLSELEFPAGALAALEGFLNRPSGLLLLTGPAGSGKTTTIYACLHRLKQLGGKHIITIEDPVERTLSGIMQTEINEAAGLSFAKAARHLLRQDPQVLVIGEIRDDETANIALRAALTGHMVISTLHAGSCRGVIDRLTTMCPENYTIFSSLKLILNQRLVRQICSACSGQGCEQCLQTGFRGRIPVVEWVEITEEIERNLRLQGSAGLHVSQTLQESARQSLEAGRTTAQEVTRQVGSV